MTVVTAIGVFIAVPWWFGCTDEPVSEPRGSTSSTWSASSPLISPYGRAGEAVRRDDLEHQGTRLSALRWGAGRPSHVLLHGGAQNAHTWDRMMLHGQLDAVAIDLPGHGRSSWMEARTYLARELAPIVAYGIDHWAPDADAVVGMSLGGLTAIRLCSIRPDLVKRLVILDVTPGSTPDRSADIREFVTATDFRSFEALFDHAASFSRTRMSDLASKPPPHAISSTTLVGVATRRRDRLARVEWTGLR